MNRLTPLIPEINGSKIPVTSGPIPALYGTPLLLIIALIAEKMPYASRSGIVAMTQLGKDPEEAAQLAGAGWFTRITRVYSISDFILINNYGVTWSVYTQ